MRAVGRTATRARALQHRQPHSPRHGTCVPAAGRRRTTSTTHMLSSLPQKRGKKALILDPSISGALMQLDAGLSELFTEHGVIK